MSSHINIVAVGGDDLPTSVEQVADAVTAHWGAAAVTDSHVPPGSLARSLSIRDADGAFQVDIGRGASRVSADGTPAQNAVVACVVRAAIPVDAPRIIAFDGSWGWHAELVAGIAPSTFAAHVVEHDETWTDPELE